MPVTTPRSPHLRAAVRVSLLSLAWSFLSGTIAVTLGRAAGSQALAAFGLETLIDGAASAVLAWRFRTEARNPVRADRVEHLASRVLGAALLLVALYLAVQATRSLMAASGPNRSAGGMILTTASILVLPLLAHRKWRLARRLDSTALGADALLSGAGMLLALVALAGLGLQTALGWWWADPLAALAIVAVLVREGLRVFGPDRHGRDADGVGHIR